MLYDVGLRLVSDAWFCILWCRVEDEKDDEDANVLQGWKERCC